MDNTPLPRKFDYRGMVITIELTGDGDHISARADVHSHGRFAGRVALSASQAERETFFDKLDRKAKELADGLLAASQPTRAGAAGRKL